MNYQELADDIEKALLEQIKKAYIEAYKKAYKELEKYKKLIQNMELLEKDLPKDWTQEQIEHWRLGFYAQEARIREIQRNIEDFFNESGEKSAEYIKEALPEYYNFSRQATIDNIQAKANISFSLLNKNAIKAIINESLPVFSKIAYKNLGQNRKACNMLRNEILQATLLGESQDKLAKRIKRVAGYQYNYQAKRTAQTERTRVQSEASYRTGKEAQALGLNITKRWSATMVRTRDTHAELNGKVVPIDDDFELSDGDKLCYPGDPKGKACNIINCRCDVIYEVDTSTEKNDNESTLFNTSEEIIENIESEFGKLKSKEIIISKKSINHINEKHNDIDNVLEVIRSIISCPDGIVVNKNYKDSIIFYKKSDIKHSINVIVRLALSGGENDINYIPTAHIIRNKELQRILKKFKTIYIKH